MTTIEDFNNQSHSCIHQHIHIPFNLQSAILRSQTKLNKSKYRQIYMRASSLKTKNVKIWFYIKISSL